jgi:hypothetical protein
MQTLRDKTCINRLETKLHHQLPGGLLRIPRKKNKPCQLESSSIISYFSMYGKEHTHTNIYIYIYLFIYLCIYLSSWLL